ncbi:PLP-dependent aminotransferase family protein [Actinomadura sp. HBU206391]|uniref:MocR-like pyridoxine biosynthesis transcription factor PdxR n=1 Tax=Actinomadura sp. HBU206391 TaxID=2731692 RepID=UPI00290585A0|nr:PLP-dependent aminotransferase family protein [Actinomadura sp. HBU206391]
MHIARARPGLPLAVDRAAVEPLSAQLVGQLRTAMRDGRLRAGERLPSSRALAGELGVSRTVVTAAYEQLYAEGWLEGRHGSGTFVADVRADVEVDAHVDVRSDGQADVRADVPADLRAGVEGGGHADAHADRPAAEGRVVSPMIDLRPGAPWAGALDTPAWRRAWRLAATVPPVTRPGSYGLPRLRAELANYMRRGRGIGCPAERVLVTRGATNGLDLLAATVVRPGDRVGVEEPGYSDARSVLAARGAKVVPCPVDEHGLIVDALPSDLRLVYTTPSHQYPLGGVLPVPRRQALLAWARRTGALIVEDDYDSEFRYDVAPLPALYGLDPDVVVYLGTTSKSLTRDVGVGWVVARPELIEGMAVRREQLGDRTAVVPQEAVAILLERGDLDRHVRRMRAEYARRRALVVDLLDGFVLRGDTAGLHVVVELPAHVAAQVVGDAARHGVRLDPLERHYAEPAGLSGLVIGYGSERLSALRTGCSLVRESILRPARPPFPAG